MRFFCFSSEYISSKVNLPRCQSFCSPPSTKVLHGLTLSLSMKHPNSSHTLSFESRTLMMLYNPRSLTLIRSWASLGSDCSHCRSPDSGWPQSKNPLFHDPVDGDIKKKSLLPNCFCHKGPILHIRLSCRWAAVIPQWFRLHLPFCGPRFQSQAHYLSFFQFVWLKLESDWEKDENKRKRGRDRSILHYSLHTTTNCKFDYSNQRQRVWFVWMCL